ncbi:erythromycin esterase family protein [Verrucosispora sioxanthis]|uniref:Erythromycin esterase family protein n=1 Tax=Verrucosispora sioxanthis TaxID=2499994 RepID=A0A6M1L2Y4_9ACTN|nr:erythromycin esterase family protein [Verrucosispora sioxanthis]NEE63797.1 erythromycin esterase family protein [Verrucosispora sioxanthis]NGM12907.1 erythromycin esterase family protein [Verrucosispora sioxanthis]
MSDLRTPVPSSAQRLAALVETATIVGLGTSTREATETFRLVEETTHELIRRGFRVVALLDNQRVGDLYDRYVRGADLDLAAALHQAWGPWRTVEMRDALVRLRRHNEHHPDDPVRVIAVNGRRALPADYERVVALLAPAEPATATRIGEMFDVIRTAHDNGEHVQRLHGTHPGVPFVDLARTARDLAAHLPDSPGRDEALRLIEGIVDFHAHALGAGYDAAAEERAAAERLLDHQRVSGDRVVFWEGSAHVAAHGATMLGAHLRAALGSDYAAVHVTFGHGGIPGRDVPRPVGASLDAVLLQGGGARIIDLRSAVPADLADRPGRPWRTRLISGLYQADHDEQHYYELPSLAGSFDAIAFVPTVTPIHPLPG